MPEKLGQYLLRHQVISQDQLNEALQCQVIFGGRLGTNLVELGYVTLDDLSSHLARRSGFPAASHEELDELPKDILGSIPRTVIEKHKVIPIRIEAKTLHCAVCDPTDLRSMDELAFSTGMRLKPFLLPELRMFFLLEKHYGIKRDIRYIRLGRTMSRGKYAGAMVGDPQTLAPKPVEAPNAQELEQKGFRPLKAGEELTTEADGQRAYEAATNGGSPPMAMAPVVMGTVATPVAAVAPVPVPAPAPAPAPAPVPAPVPVAAVPAPAPTPAPAPAAEPVIRGVIEPDTNLPVLELTDIQPVGEITPLPVGPITYSAPASPEEAAALRGLLSSAADREDVAGAALRLGRSQFAVVALFIVKGSGADATILGWKGAGDALDKVSIEHVMLPAAGDSILKAPAGGVIFQGPIPAKGLNDRLLAALGRATRPATAAVLPISVKNRVINLLYADNGPAAITPEAAGWLQVLARDVGTAYERIILSKKKSSAETASR